MSYKNTIYSSGYLNIGYYWWLLNPYSTSSVRGVSEYGTSYYYISSTPIGSRPSINLKLSVVLTDGDGSKTNPYRIVGDKEDAIPNTTLLNTRTSGEYVNFDGELYRIVSIEKNGTIKLTKNDYIKDTNSSTITKKFASTTTFGAAGNAESADYWDYYLNNTWYTSVSSEYQSMMIEGTYYLGQVNDSGVSYKKAICSTVSSTVSTNDCEKTVSTWTGLVGLPRYGEMFASQQGSGYSDSNSVWLITPCLASYVWSVSNIGYGNNYFPSSTLGSRPSINLKSTVKITGGTGLKEEPYEISL